MHAFCVGGGLKTSGAEGGFRGERCPPTALYRLCGQRNGKLSACRRCWPLVNGLSKTKPSQLQDVWR